MSTTNTHFTTRANLAVFSSESWPLSYKKNLPQDAEVTRTTKGAKEDHVQAFPPLRTTDSLSL